ncbi:phosphohistidine phosphatase SixA [Psychrobacter sp.]|uniref:phosphohistidine phosphatase SixA n=1 Tax=Psychrobacter sp. TaxID=56811 RepID=UPI0025FD0D8C|nr:phosphohistidine phosphatase SixA [Psychrobacter sp.]
MKVILMRHGEAERQTQQDSERTLTDLGQQQAAETAQYIVDKYNPDLFIVSPYVRAQQTLQALTTLKPDVPVKVQSNITPEDEPTRALHDLTDVEVGCVVVVCHMPIVAKMAALLTADVPESYHLAEARIFDAELIAPDMGSEIDRYVPKLSL